MTLWWPERPNVALGALDAPNVAFGALDAPNVALGRMGVRDTDLGARRSGVGGLGPGDLDEAGAVPP
ncbi:hypothetical protein GCM10023192_68140 [Amycolatopsis samaneae]